MKIKKSLEILHNIKKGNPQKIKMAQEILHSIKTLAISGSVTEVLNLTYPEVLALRKKLEEMIPQDDPEIIHGDKNFDCPRQPRKSSRGE